MAYSIGSGTYVDLMAAVLTFAQANGWTGTWPISNGGSVGALNWTTETFGANDYTVGGAGTPKTQRNINFHIGQTVADTAIKTRLPNMEYSLNWFLFADNTKGKHIHGVVRFNNGVNSDCYGHFSFGDIDKEGMTHSGLGYVSAHYQRGFAAGVGGIDQAFGDGSGDWNSIFRAGFHFAGREGANDEGFTDFAWFAKDTNPPFPVGNGWPTPGVTYGSGANLWKTTRPSIQGHSPHVEHHMLTLANTSFPYKINPPINWFPFNSRVQPFSGAVSFAPIPVFPLAGSGTGARMMMVGSIPNVRTCSLDGYVPEEEVTFAGETWKLFPFLRKTDNSLLGRRLQITSGMLGLAYKMVT